ncbi:MAG: nucleotide exchange factor GrpE [Burkholderia sp.]|nr:nucleotide exchange factor GrpE [Burkholderia sp.]
MKNMQENSLAESTDASSSEMYDTIQDSQQISSEINTNNKEFDNIQEKITEIQEDYLRAKAETENIRRRSQEEVLKASKFAIENFTKQILPVLDSLEAAVIDKSDNLTKIREGIDLTLRQMKSAFEKCCVIQLNPIGEKFNPYLHQAISTVPANQEPNTVITVLQKGYRIADRVLRPALVIVTKSMESEKLEKNNCIESENRN